MIVQDREVALPEEIEKTICHKDETHKGIVEGLKAQVNAMQKEIGLQTEELKACQLVNVELEAEKLVLLERLTSVELNFKNLTAAADTLAMKAVDAEAKLLQVWTIKIWRVSLLDYLSIKVDLILKAMVCSCHDHEFQCQS